MLKKLFKLMALIICLLPALIFLFSPIRAQAATEPVITFQLQEQIWEGQCRVLKGEPPLLPLREISWEAGAAVEWHQESGLVFYYAGGIAAAFHPRLDYIYFFQENPAYKNSEDNPIEIDIIEGGKIEDSKIEDSIIERGIIDGGIIGEGLKNDENILKTPPVLFTKVKGVKPLTILNGISYINGENLAYLSMEGFWDENYTYLEIVLNPEIYGVKAPAPGTADSLYRLIKEDVAKELSLIPRLLGSFISKFNSGDKNRTVNLKLSAAALNGAVIAPGENFSFNNRVGERTPQRGYLKAIIFSYGEKELGYGGGVCQVSSTLYNGVLEAKLPVLERHPHSRAVDYIPLGKDATVAYGSKDFRFKNDTESKIMIVCRVDLNSLEVGLWRIA